jgi:hypothetical protein
VSTLVGREPELAEVAEFLRADEAEAVTVHGLHKTTDPTGAVKFKFGPKVKGTFTVGITRPGYWQLTKTAGF